MTEQYFAREPKVAHRRASISLSLRGITLDLITDAGVFSRDGVDPGSLLLMRSVEPPAEGAILDLGCGYGPIGLYYAARAPRCTVHLSDVNERAVALSRENAARNRLTNVQVHAGPGLAPLAGLVLDMIVTNPPIRAGRSVLLELFRNAHDHLREGGQLAFVALTRQGAKTLAKEVESIFGSVDEVAKGSGYRVFSATR